MKRRSQQGDPLERIREAQDHRYDPGYFTGGQIDPLLAAPRPNRYGWVLVVLGVLLLVAVWSTPRGDTPWFQYFGASAFAVLFLLAGVKLLRRRKLHKRSRSHADRSADSGGS